MKINLSDDAIKWFEKEFPLNKGEAIRFFGKTYGQTEVHDGFSVGIQLDKPENYNNILSITEVNGRKYFTAHEDLWFFEGYNLVVNLDNQLHEPSYHFNSQ